MEPIIRNAAKCNACGDVLESKFKYDFVTCSCGNLSIDGGHDYIRRIYKSAGYTDLAEYADNGRTESDTE